MPPAESVTHPAPRPPAITIHLDLEGAVWLASSAETDSEFDRLMDWVVSSDERRSLFRQAIDLALDAEAA